MIGSGTIFNVMDYGAEADGATDDAANRVFKLNGAANGGMAVSFNLPSRSSGR